MELNHYDKNLIQSRITQNKNNLEIEKLFEDAGYSKEHFTNIQPSDLIESKGCCKKKTKLINELDEYISDYQSIEQNRLEALANLEGLEKKLLRLESDAKKAKDHTIQHYITRFRKDISRKIELMYQSNERYDTLKNLAIEAAGVGAGILLG